MNKTIGIILLIVILLTACSGPMDEPPVEMPTSTEIPQATTTPTPTETPPVVFTICTASLPETLFPYSKSALYAGAASEAKARVLAYLYPTPLTGDGELVLESLPGQSNADLRLDPVPIRRGQTVVDGRGELVTATEGVWVRPSGCRSADCAISWDGLTPLEMDQMVIDFRLKAGLTWSDGAPLMAADSVFSFRLASMPDSPAYGWAEARTQGYSALDERTVSWRGYPGFTSPDLSRFFWRPLPAHAFDPAADFTAVAADAVWTAAPPAYGPFAVAAWAAEELRLVRNPYYPSAEAALPGVDQVVIRAVDGGAGAGWDALQAGTCDMLDASFRLEAELGLLAEVEAAGTYGVQIQPGASWTQLVFGIQPAEYDALANPVFAQRPDFFRDARTRQGIAHCLDREAMLTFTTQGRGQAWPSFLPPGASRLDAGMDYDPQAGITLLEAVGWWDHDGDPATPRIAQGVLTVFNGIPLSLRLLAGPAAFHQDLAGVIRDSLTACGIGVDVQTLSLADLYAPGPEGPLFGRGFDLALIAWQPLPVADCGLYTSWGVPTPGNGWIGTNIAGFSDDAYDRACSAAALALPGEDAVLLAQAEALFVDLLPAVPLIAPPGAVEVGGW